MPLAESAPRKLLHNRTVTCRGYEREDGLWDIEGQMTDVKNYNFNNHDRGEIKAGEPLHEMWIRLTIDLNFLIHDAEASTDHSPYTICPEIVSRYKQLIGMRIGPGWNLKIRQLFNGVNGCTHITELLGPVATTAYQTLFSRRAQQTPKNANGKPPRILNSCHALASDSVAVLRNWPQFYTGSDSAPKKQPTDR